MVCEYSERELCTDDGRPAADRLSSCRSPPLRMSADDLRGRCSRGGDSASSTAAGRGGAAPRSALTVGDWSCASDVDGGEKLARLSRRASDALAEASQSLELPMRSEVGLSADDGRAACAVPEALAGRVERVGLPRGVEYGSDAGEEASVSEMCDEYSRSRVPSSPVFSRCASDTSRCAVRSVFVRARACDASASDVLGLLLDGPAGTSPRTDRCDSNGAEAADEHDSFETGQLTQLPFGGSGVMSILRSSERYTSSESVPSRALNVCRVCQFAKLRSFGFFSKRYI